MSDYAWFCLKNIVVIVATCLSVYFISGWMIVMALCWSSSDEVSPRSDPS